MPRSAASLACARADRRTIRIPPDILRGYLAAATVRQLSFSGASRWANVIDAETDKDAGALFNIAGRSVSKAKGKKSAQLVTETIPTFKTRVLNNPTQLHLQTWTDGDDSIVTQLIPVLTSATRLPA